MIASRFLGLLPACLLLSIATAQEPRATLSGQVVEAVGGRPLRDAAVLLLPSDPPLGAVTDSLGRFTLKEVPVGLYTVEVRLLGHETLLVPETWLRAGKETVLRVALRPAAFELATFTVSALAREEPEPLGVRSFTVEQGLRHPAMFQDPARLVAGTPGVAAPNDQANHLSIRGNNPNTNAWLLEGAEIVSPNHTGNAGTPSDLPTLSGGGVNILSAQMLGPSRLRTGVSPTLYGNALGGLMDMELRRGNVREREWTMQAGLLGIDLSTEGPIGKDERSFHLVNYRYSTIGLLSAMGVDLGDETIAFQDLAFHAGTGIGEHGELRLFGLGGLSSNVFEAVRDTAEWEFNKDNRDITYRSRMGALGTAIMLPAGAHAALHATVVWSALAQEREETALRNDLEPWPTQYSELEDRKLSTVVRLEGAAGGRVRYTVGGSTMLREVYNLWRQEVSGWLLRPFAQARFDATEHLQVTAGVAFSHFTYNGSALLEPRAGLRWRMAKGRALGISWGVRGQMPPYHLLYTGSGASYASTRDLDLQRSEDLTIGYDHHFGERWSVRLEIYDQRLTRLPVTAGLFGIPPPFSSTVNVWDEPVLLPLASVGEARNTGVELSAQRTFMEGWYAQANGSVFQSTWQDRGVERDTRWNASWTANLLGGREWRKPKEDRVRTWGLGARLYAMGGLRYTPIVVQDPETPFPVLDGPSYSAGLASFFRTDLRVYLKKDRAGRTGQWALDLQNATNARNEAFLYFDQRKGEIVTKYQLGLIPNLSYRIEF
ncbi:MAG: TonB-dependent receptor [Flavobacteriales bacterium]|nr:TonB-dependent receptor [Flavobacteriales bacterium]